MDVILLEGLSTLGYTPALLRHSLHMAFHHTFSGC